MRWAFMYAAGNSLIRFGIKMNIGTVPNAIEYVVACKGLYFSKICFWKIL